MPTIDGWSKKYPRDSKRVKVKFDRAGRSMIELMQAEYDALETRLDAVGFEKSSEGLKKYFFGEKSCFAQAVTKNLDLTND